ncbi:hypothetical protein NWFMUON74_37220 [Nocardia wallacei]|uniref:Uncharacterized protein n=1 Tax=Nocardia wallacei TaxID=480035 RepID=A0A7G1KLM4_9NOCA|nr:hypothetical protein NWFMUON74_37220 [Nocardia wallacei]
MVREMMPAYEGPVNVLWRLTTAVDRRSDDRGRAPRDRRNTLWRWWLRSPARDDEAQVPSAATDRAGAVSFRGIGSPMPLVAHVARYGAPFSVPE